MRDSLSFDINNKSILKFAGMSVLLMIFISLYVTIDGIFVSNYVGSLGLSALNIVLPATNFFIAIAVMFGIGGSAICATKIGERKYRSARMDFSNIFAFAVVFTIALIIPILYFIEPIIYKLGANDDILHYAKDYLFIYLLFVPALVIQLLCQSFLFAVGKPQKAFTLTMIGGIANIIFDYVFIALFDMELIGAALATGVGEVLAGGYGIYCFIKIKKLSLRFVKPNFHMGAIAKSAFNGSSEMVNSVAASIMIYLFNKNMMELAGTDGVAAITIILYIEFLMAAMYIGYANGVSPLFSFNHGEKNDKKLKILLKKSIKFIAISSVFCIVFALCMADILVSTFVNRGTEVFDLATAGLRIFSFAFVFMGFNLFISALFTAFSNGKISAILSFFRTLVFIVGFLIILPKYMGVLGVWLAVPLAEVLMFVISIILLKKYKKIYKY